MPTPPRARVLRPQRKLCTMPRRSKPRRRADTRTVSGPWSKSCKPGRPGPKRGLDAGRPEQARDTVDKADTTLVQIRNEAVRQIVVARNTLTTSISAYGAATALTSAAQTTFNAALAAYRNGVGSISDATTAERQLLAAKNAATDAYSTALSAAATLALATGVLGSAPN